MSRPKIQPNQENSLGDEGTRYEDMGSDSSSFDFEMTDLSARYQIERTIGLGGMGEVLLATDKRLGRKVAIKRVREQTANIASVMRRFTTEARAIAQISHDAVIALYDYGHDAQGPYLILEYVEGGSVADKLKSGPFTLQEAVNIICQLSEGLGKAHALGIIHRDIKPANILLNYDNKPKLTDFGLAKYYMSDSDNTTVGTYLGTIDFMAPEQRQNSSLTDARSDLWSLAATFYQMVTGNSPRTIRINKLPKQVQSFITKALEDNPDQRYQNAPEFRSALESSIKDSRHRNKQPYSETSFMHPQPQINAMNMSTVIELLDNTSGNFRYGEIAEKHGRLAAKNGMAVGSIMSAICRLGRHDLCERVVDAFGNPHCKR
jgi:serine/threonine protein kinase